MKPQVSYDWDGLRQLCRRLRQPGGCKWDRQQTLESLTPYLLEETYEVLEACAHGEDRGIAEELGDLLYLLVFALTIAEEERRFTFEDVARGMVTKLIARHPHVFNVREADLDFDQTRRQWESIKRVEKRERGDRRDTLAPGAGGLPALLLAYRVQEKAASFGFDWPDAAAVLAKLDEERAELAAVLADAPSAERDAAAEEETGDLLFTLVNLARHLNADPDRLLRAAVAKFRKRFAQMEARLAERGVALSDVDLETMEQAWQDAKSTPPTTRGTAGEEAR